MTNEEIKKLLLKENSNVVEWLPLIEHYILEKKGVMVKINLPSNMVQLELYSIAWKTVFKYYAEQQLVN